jgi:erythromycin esterase-like protein
MMRRLLSALIAAALLGGAPAFAEPPAVDLKAVDRIVDGAELVVFGEDSHAMLAVHELVPVLFEHLAQTKGFRLFVFESAWAVSDQLQDFVDSDRTGITPQESLLLNAFNSRPTIDMLMWIRAWNRAHPSDRIQVAGYQPEQPVTDRAAIIDLFAKAGRADEARAALDPCVSGAPDARTDIDFISAVGALRHKRKLPSYSSAARAACLKALAGLDAGLVRGKARFVKTAGDGAWQEGRMHVLSLKTYVAVISADLDEQVLTKVSPYRMAALDRQGYTEGDRVRSEIFQTLMRTRYHGRKAFLWMHDWHAFKQAERTGMGEPGAAVYMPSLTTRLAAAYGPRLKSIGSIVPCPSAGEPPLRCDEPPGSLEPAFAARFGEQPGVVDFSDPASVGDLPVASSGRLYANFHRFGFTDVVLNQQFDGLIYLPDAKGVAK